LGLVTEQECNENVFPIHTSSIHYVRCPGGSLWLGPLAAMQSKYRIQKTVGQFRRVEQLVPGLVFFWFRGGWRKSLQLLHIGGNPKLDLEREQDSGTNLIMLELWTNQQIAATNTGCKVQTCFPLQVWMFFQLELGTWKVSEFSAKSPCLWACFSPPIPSFSGLCKVRKFC